MLLVRSMIGIYWLYAQAPFAPWPNVPGRLCKPERADIGSRAGWKARALVVTIYKICERAMWPAAVAAGLFRGSPVDQRDGFVHFSTADQLAATAAKYFAGQTDLMLLAVDGAALGPQLRWEISRGGERFPHLYGALPVSAVRWARPLPDEIDGRRPLPELEP